MFARPNERFDTSSVALAQTASGSKFIQTMPRTSLTSSLTASDRAAHAALLRDKYGLPSVEQDDTPEWECPIDFPGCNHNCGSYGCGN